MLTKIHADLSVSISELKRNPQAIIDDAGGKAIALLNHNKPTAYIVPAATYERLIGVAADTESGNRVEPPESEGKAPPGVDAKTAKAHPKPATRYSLTSRSRSTSADLHK